MNDLTKDSSKDPFDEFEFRPLSDGLGFYKKPQTAAAGFELREPLPRKNTPKVSIDFQEGPPVPPPQIPDFKPIVTAAPEPEKKLWVTSIWEPGAVLLDALLLAALFLMSLIALILTTRVDFFASLSSPDPAKWVYWSLAGLGFFLIFTYLTMTRLFLGATLGEWVFDQRLGTPKDFVKPMYPVQTILRSFLITVSGIVVLPMISFAINSDLLGRWLGIELVRKADR